MTRPAGWKGFGWATQAGCPECQAMPSASWYFNWTCESALTCPVCGNVWNPYTYSPYFVPMLYSGMSEYVYTHPNENLFLRNLLSSYPGRAWMVWNEPDINGYSPEVAAENYARAYWFIKHNDPTAWVGGPNLVCMDSEGYCTTAPWCQLPENHGKDYFQEFVQRLRTFTTEKQQTMLPGIDHYCVHTWPYAGAGGMLPLTDDANRIATYGTLNKHINWIRDPQFADVV